MATIKGNLREIRKVIEELGLSGLNVKRRSSSIGIEVVGPRGRRMVFASITPSDWRTARNLRTELRRAARDVGLQVN